ncbi:hypothetical protein [Roseibium sediminicola]|uniref:GpW protein n=1 Tax=Roseibium sediminicola TaxID=2933272 RepID=A0ABT0H1L4_9HYPH|nr:hypothetical protein [Roseibium sp. CAU 1639]MCK7615192.1 hypothetical protein [Roseibium sp. CAU 1639]
MTREQIEQAISDLEAARLKMLTGTKRVEITSSEGGGVKYQVATVGEINQEIARLKVELSKLTGDPSGVGPIIAAFGGRG